MPERVSLTRVLSPFFGLIHSSVCPHLHFQHFILFDLVDLILFDCPRSRTKNALSVLEVLPSGGI